VDVVDQVDQVDLVGGLEMGCAPGFWILAPGSFFGEADAAAG
jgi:hypothetical protein